MCGCFHLHTPAHADRFPRARRRCIHLRMSHKSSKHSAERSAHSQAQDAAASTSSSSARKRSNTKHSLHPPTIHLSLKKSSSTFFSSSSRSPVGSSPDYDGSSRSSPRKTTAGTEIIPGSPSSVVYPSTPTPSPGRSTLHSLGYGAHRATAGLAASPDRLSLLTVPTSLPLSLSALSGEPSLELVQPSPSSVSSMRRPSSSREQSSSPFMRGRIPSKAPSISNFHAPTRGAASSAPTSRKGSGGSTDRDAGMHLDIKRLMSKPGSSAASDSETCYYRRTTSLSKPSSSQRMTTTSGPTRRATDEPIMEHTPRESETRISPVSEAEGERVQKQRNVLRRKASARSNPATPTASTFQQQQQNPPALPAESRSVFSLKPRESRQPKRSVSATAQVVSLSNIARQRSPPRNLTPAGAVAHAYMKQEERREALAEISGSNDLLRGGSPSLRDKSTDSRGTFFDDDDDDEEGSGAYYTVFGSSAGRVVAVGSAEDSSWGIDFDSRFSHERFSSKSSLQSPMSTQSLSGMRGLSRKVSGKPKKSHEGTRHRIGDIYEGRASTSTGRPLGPLTDGFVDVRTHITAGAAVSPEKKDKEPRVLRPMRSFMAKEKEVDKPREEDSTSGGKLWKLMKRISTGALREKFTQDPTPPPVPALPDNFKHLASSRTTFDIRGPTADTSSETGLKQFMTSRASMSAVRPSTAPGKGSPRAERPGSRPSTGPRPSTTTRSSSPMSSDIASSRFFPKSQSTRSSISSYGEELPPMPGASGVGQNIMSPGELYKLSKDVEDIPMRKSSRRSRSRRTQSAGNKEVLSPDEVRPSLPPPRRSTAGGIATADSESDPPSPMIPAFDISEPLNDFSSATVASRASLPTSEFGVLSDSKTPPRPKRSSRRKPPPFELVSPTTSTPISPPMPVTPRTPRTPNLPAIDVDVPNSIDRNSMVGSMHSHSTAREGYSASPSSASFRSPIRFRELEAPRVQLSEREKAAKWDDLLARSDEAGGTLHLGEVGLMSDNIRFSEYSEI